MSETEYVTSAPHPALRGGVLSITGYSEHSLDALSRREVAQDVVTLILNLGPPLMVGGREEPLRPHDSFIAAMNGHYGLTEFTGDSRGIQVDLSPSCAHRLFGVPMNELSAVVVPLEDVVGHWGNALVERLGNIEGWERRFDVLQRDLWQRLEESAPASPDVVRAWSLLQGSGGTIPVASLTRDLSCSGRHLSTRFREQIGVGPKASARIIRFRRAVDLLAADDGSRFAEIAAGCGYSDQPHMNREFRAMAGCSPTSLIASRMVAVPGYAQDEQVTFVQAAASIAA